jgi:hypothetical protein
MICIPVVQAWNISYLEAIKELLNSPHFCQIVGHVIIVAVVFFLYLFCHELSVSPDEKSSNAELFG